MDRTLRGIEEEETGLSVKAKSQARNILNSSQPRVHKQHVLKWSPHTYRLSSYIRKFKQIVFPIHRSHIIIRSESGVVKRSGCTEVVTVMHHFILDRCAVYHIGVH
jgi:hypothetical protein